MPLVFVVTTVLILFAVFAGAMTYAQIKTRGIVAPGARPLE